MEASHFLQSRILITTPAQPRHTHGHNKLRSSPTVGVLTTPADIKPADARDEKRRVYNDNWFDLLAINYLSKNLQAATGVRNNKTGFESLVEATTAASTIFKPEQQRKVAIQSLKSAIPSPVLTMVICIPRVVEKIRTMLPDSQFARETFAVFTTIFFAWLVGPSEVRESELNGRKEKNAVHIKKCRFLEESNCVGMCINMCKVPSQTFVKDSFGIPVNMVPNFDDMSCEMVFGQNPPELSDDPALKQPCFKLCKVTQRHTSNDCSK